MKNDELRRHLLLLIPPHTHPSTSSQSSQSRFPCTCNTSQPISSALHLASANQPVSNPISNANRYQIAAAAAAAPFPPRTPRDFDTQSSSPSYAPYA